MVQSYVKHRETTIPKPKPATINRELSHISKSFTLGIKERLITTRPVIERFKENNRRKGFFEETEFRKAHAYLPPAIKPIAELAYFTGMREGELLSIKWEQVDLIECCIRLKETKNGDPREIYYGENPELKSLIDSQWERKLEVQKRKHRRVEYLFFRNTGKKVKDFRVCWNKAIKKAGLKGKRIFHDLRRTAVRNLIRAGVPETVAQLISGHQTRSVFERYNIRDPRSTRAALGMVSRLSTKLEKLNFEYNSSTIDSKADPQVQQTNNLDSLSTERLQ